MLVLSRRKNESIVINDDITIVVVEIRGDKVRLGVEAPKECPVHRREVYEAIHRNDPPIKPPVDPPIIDAVDHLDE
jgi:carbon storage regulator